MLEDFTAQIVSSSSLPDKWSLVTEVGRGSLQNELAIGCRGANPSSSRAETDPS